MTVEQRVAFELSSLPWPVFPTCGFIIVLGLVRFHLRNHQKDGDDIEIGLKITSESIKHPFADVSY
jgi:hypothetical protein